VESNQMTASLASKSAQARCRHCLLPSMRLCLTPLRSEGRWSDKREKWVLLGNYKERDPNLTVERHHDRADQSLAFWTLTDPLSAGRRSVCTKMHELTMAVAIMGEAHIQTHKLKATDDRSQWWLCIVAAACDLKLFGEVTSVMCGISMLT